MGEHKYGDPSAMVMINFANSKKSFEIIDSIIKSMKTSIMALEHSGELHQTAYDSVSKVLKFLNNTIILLPLIIYSKESSKISKEDLLRSFDNVLSSWSEYLMCSEKFKSSWQHFLIDWDNYKSDFIKSGELSRTIFLSMN